MKAQRYLHPDRHLDQAIENDDMNDNTDLESADGEQPAAATTLAVEVGRAMPPADPNALPLLNTPLAAPVPLASDCSTVAEGMQFDGPPEGSKTPDLNPDAIYTVTEVYDSHVVLDGNHPLAGLAVRISLKVLDVRPATEEEIEQGSVSEALLGFTPSAPPGETLH